MKKLFQFFLAFCLFGILSSSWGCKHDPVFTLDDDDMMPMDTTMNPTDTMMTDLCDTVNVSFSEFVNPEIETHCKGCHSGNNPGGGILLTNHEEIKEVADNGKLYGTIAHEDGFEAMPQGADQLDSCVIVKIKAWIDAGAQNN